jgi:hypothetical protein
MILQLAQKLDCFEYTAIPPRVTAPTKIRTPTITIRVKVLATAISEPLSLGRHVQGGKLFQEFLAVIQSFL